MPSKRSFSGILPDLPIQFSESLLANAKPQSLAEREVLFQAGPGSIVGELAIIDGLPRSATVVAAPSLISAPVNEDTLKPISDTNPSINQTRAWSCGGHLEHDPAVTPEVQKIFVAGMRPGQVARPDLGFK
jgi:hypothetical protein